MTCPCGCTVILKVCEVPAQLTPPFVNVGVIVIVAVTGDVPVLLAVNDGIPVTFPILLAAKPMLGVSFVHA